MKKFYGSLAITSIIIAHVSARFIMADAYTFSESDYINPDIYLQSSSVSAPSETVSLNENQFGLGYNSNLLSNARFITTDMKGTHSFNQ